MNGKHSNEKDAFVSQGLSAVATDIGSSYCVLGLMGPNAREVLSRAAPHDDVSTEALPFGMSKEIGVGYALCRASRVTYVVRKTPLFAPFIYKNDHFAKTGSGQT